MTSSSGPILFHRKAVIATADVACVAAAAVASAGLALGGGHWLRYVEERLPSFVVLLALAPPVFYLCGLYSTRRLRRARNAVLPAVTSVALLLLLASAWWYLTSSPEIGRRVFVRFALLCVAGVLATRYAYAKSRGILDVRTLVVGSPRLSADVAALLRHHPDAPLRVLGLVQCPEEGRRAAGAVEPPPAFPVVGHLDDLEELVAVNRVDRLVLPPRLREYPELFRRVRPLSYQGVSLVDFVSLYEELAQEVPLDHVDDDWLFAAAAAPSQLHIRRLKRLTDVAASVLMIVAAAPLLLVAALAVKLTSRGPALFRQERIGLASKPFTVLKLRTMREDAEARTGPVWSSENDPRITPVGRILRKFRIDELPQLWNVLRGDMSLVGPRPERPVFVKSLSDAIPHYSERLLVRPGITGWAQVRAPYAASVGDSARKLQFDLYYTKNLSFSIDALILLLTVKTVLLGRERTQGGLTAGRQLSTPPFFQALDLDAGQPAVAPRRGPRAEPARGKIAQA
jgi:exopolysaccharide biosynthesis polyprenyl glycosylphosphotransferase